MRSLSLLILIFTNFNCYAQYYYKDVLGGRETADLIKAYHNNKVLSVTLTSYNADNSKNNDFFAQQLINGNILTTITRSSITNESVLTSIIESGRVIKTIDSSDALTSITLYDYNQSGQLIKTTNTTSDTSHSIQMEQHIWEYNNNTPIRMLRIKNSRDTSFINLKSDEKGNVIEENEIHSRMKSEPVYYYYDGNNRLTDIVRFNKRANRLLPEYMFEYSTTNQVIQQITVPANNSEYIIWRFQYNDRGLKIKEAVYNKQKQLNGTIVYDYTYGS